MTQTFFRIQSASRDAAELLDPANWVSRHWSEQEDMDRPGVSVCDSRESLAHYLAVCGIPYGLGEWNVVELAGERRYDAAPCDAHAGELLVNPSEIIAVTPLDEAFLELVGEAYDRLEARA